MSRSLPHSRLNALSIVLLFSLFLTVCEEEQDSGSVCSFQGLYRLSPSIVRCASVSQSVRNPTAGGLCLADPAERNLMCALSLCVFFDRSTFSLEVRVVQVLKMRLKGDSYKILDRSSNDFQEANI